MEAIEKTNMESSSDVRSPHSENTVRSLRSLAWELRLDALRMVSGAKSGHLGGSFSAAELITALCFYKARLDPRNPGWEDRDRIFVSKGHCAPIYYAALCRLCLLYTSPSPRD